MIDCNGISIVEGKIIPAFHPIIVVNASKKPKRYFEVLARLQQENGYILQPSQFLGCLVDKKEVDLAMLNLIPFLQYTYPGTFFSFNITPESLKNRFYFDQLVSEVYNGTMKPSQLMIELVEDAAEFDPKCDLYDKLQHLKDIGFKIAIDDFGSGESNLERISNSQFDIIKLSGRLNLSKERTRKIVSEFIKMMRCVCDDVSIVIEGVETLEQLAIAKNCGADFVQGYVFGKPKVNEPDMVEFNLLTSSPP